MSPADPKGRKVRSKDAAPASTFASKMAAQDERPPTLSKRLDEAEGRHRDLLGSERLRLLEEIAGLRIRGDRKAEEASQLALRLAALESRMESLQANTSLSMGMLAFGGILVSCGSYCGSMQAPVVMFGWGFFLSGFGVQYVNRSKTPPTSP